jgi:ankyrin repeat protein
MTLHDAITGRDAVAVARILEDPAVRSTLNEPIPGGAFGETALIAAVRHADRAVIDLLLQAGADINQKSHWWAGGFHVLDDASREPWLASYLIGRGAVVEIHHAVRFGMMDDVRQMLAADPSLVHARGGDGQLPLHFAQSIEMADRLLSHGAHVDARDVDHESTAAQWMVRDRHEIARYLVEQGSDADLLMAAALGDTARVTALLDERPDRIFTRVSGAWFSMKDPRAGGSIYIWTLGKHKRAHAIAREFGRDTVLDVLLPRTPDVLRLADACESGDESGVRDLLRRKPDLASDLPPEERKGIVDAAECNNTAAVRLMLEAGWPVDASGPSGITALHWAGFHGNSEMARTLLRYHAPVHVIETDFKGTPLSWAEHGSAHGWFRATGDYPATIAALVAAGAAPEDRQS